MRRILPILLTLLLVCGCASTPKSADNGKLNIVVSNFPLYDFVRAVGGDKVNIKMLIKPGTEVHSFDPSPSDIAAIYNSDLFMYIGGESDSWARRIEGDTKVKTVTFMNKVNLLTEDGEDEFDEHIWTSPKNAISMLNIICDELSVIDAKNASEYKINLKNYADKINEVSKEIETIVSSVKDPFILVADRFPFKYFTTEFGISYEAAFGGCATSTDISLNTMTRLVNVVKDRNCKVVYTTEMSNKSIADALCGQLNLKCLELHSAHNVTIDDFNNNINYVEIMHRNAKALREGMF